MKLPDFNAESALGKPKNIYRTQYHSHGLGNNVLPAQFETTDDIEGGSMEDEEGTFGGEEANSFDGEDVEAVNEVVSSDEDSDIDE